MTSTTDIPWYHRYHDAVVRDIQVDWRVGEVRLGLTKVGGARTNIIATGFSMFHVPREHPWGPSVFVLEMELDERSDGTQRLLVQMQTGDEVEIVATRIIEQPDATYVH